MKNSLSILILGMIGFSSAGYSIDKENIQIPNMKMSESVLPSNIIKANSEVQVRKVQKMMAANRDQTFGMLNQLRSFSEKSGN